jgi:hypothetical protein
MLMSHRPTFLIWSLLSLVSAGSTGAELPFPVAEAKMQTLPDEQILDGVVEAVNQSTVSAQTAGRVETIMVDVNDYVPQGAPIIRIRNIEQRAGSGTGAGQSARGAGPLPGSRGRLQPHSRRLRTAVVSKAQMDAPPPAWPPPRRDWKRLRPAFLRLRNRWAIPPSMRLIAASC